MTSPLAARRCVLEVERKFRSLAVSKLTQHGGKPSFQSLRQLPSKTFHDTYYDRSNMMSSAGSWIRLRDGKWQAKIRKGGDFLNSRFEELDKASDIEAHVRQITGRDKETSDNFGLLPIAAFSTLRETWSANNDFRIVLDTADFGHVVGEVELQYIHEIAEGQVWSEEEKNKVMGDMDNKISDFMKMYSWAFSQGEPKGKLTAYFERMQG